jgi:hypothetical protein
MKSDMRNGKINLSNKNIESDISNMEFDIYINNI